MAIDAIVRASFQTHVKGNQAVNKALVGHTQDPTGTGPFERVNTQVFVASARPDADVHAALASLMNRSARTPGNWTTSRSLSRRGSRRRRAARLRCDRVVRSRRRLSPATVARVAVRQSCYRAS